MIQSDVLANDGSFGDSPHLWDNFDELDKWNPARPELLRNWKHAPPTLVIHSDKDYRCPITEGLATFNTLQAQGVPSRFLTFSDEGHWVAGPENSLVVSYTCLSLYPDVMLIVTVSSGIQRFWIGWRDVLAGN